MIKFEHTVTPSPEEMEFVIEGMRNPMESWDQSDSGWIDSRMWRLGQNDWDLMKKLCKNGSDERKFMRQMPVMVRITAPLYWWKEFDTYKVGTVSNSCSTMHKIHAKEFEEADFSTDQLCEIDGDDVSLIDGDTENWKYYKHRFEIGYTIEELNFARNLYNAAVKKLKRSDLTAAERKHAEAQKKRFWWQMIQLLPSSYNQTRNITLNYEVLHNMYHARKHHKLDEWRIGFCDWCKSLPYPELITEEWEENADE